MGAVAVPLKSMLRKGMCSTATITGIAYHQAQVVFVPSLDIIENPKTLIMIVHRIQIGRPFT